VPGWKKLREINTKADYWFLLFLPDGESVLAGGWGGEVTRWQIGTGQRVGSFGPSDEKASLSRDGRFLATTRGDTVHLWDVATGRELSSFKVGTSKVAAVAFSPDGKTVAAGTFDGPIQLWNVASGQQAGTLLGPRQFVWSLDFSPDESSLVGNAWDNTIRLWKAPTWPQIDAGNFPR
jgi:WD40 repeat protein